MFYINSPEKLYGPYRPVNPNRSVKALTPLDPTEPISALEKDLSELIEPVKNKPKRTPYSINASQRKKSVESADDLMSSPPITITSDMSCQSAWEVMKAKKFRHLPVVNADGKLIGIITRSDILKAVVSKAPLDLWA